MTPDAPTWGSWTTYYNSVEGLKIDASVRDTDLQMHVILTGFTLTVGQDAPLAGAVGLAGELSASVPETFDLMGFKLIANCFIDKFASGEALLTCSIGTSTHTTEWPQSGPPHPRPTSSRTNGGRSDRNGKTSSDFITTCFMPEDNPANFGDPHTHTPLPPFPITLSMQARCRTAHEPVFIKVQDLVIFMTRSS